MTWTITTTTTISASRAVTLAERIPSEPIKFVVLHPGTGAGGTVTIWDDLGKSVASTRIDALSPRHEAEFFSDRSIFNVSAAIDGNATLSGAGVSVYLVSREAPEPSIADGSTSFAGGAQFGGAAAAPNINLSEAWINSSLRNVFDATAPGTTEEFYLNDSGVPVSAATTNISQPIYMDAGTRFVVLSDSDSYPSFRGCFFTAAGAFHSTIASSPAHAGSTTIFAMPSGAAYARVNYRRANLHFIGVERANMVSGYDVVSFVGNSNVAGGIGGFSDVAGVTTQMARIMGGATVYNRGAANRKLSGSGGMHEAVLTTDPDANAMVVLGGGNDHADQVALGDASSTNTAEFNGALNAICAHFTTKRVWQKLFLCTFTERTGTELTIPVDSYNAAIIAAGVRWTVPVIDLRNLVGADPDMSTPIVNLLFPDGRHWSWYMQRIAANAVCRRMMEG